MLSTSAADAPGKNSTTGAGEPPTPRTRPAECCTPDPAYSPSASSTRYSTCFPATSTSHSKSHGAPTRTSPDAYHAPNTSAGKALMRTEIDRLSNAGVPRSLTEIITLGRTLKRRATDILAYFDHPHTTGGPTEAINAPPQTPTRIRTRNPQPHPLHHPSTPRNRRIQTPTTPPIMKNPKTGPDIAFLERGGAGMLFLLPTARRRLHRLDCRAATTRAQASASESAR